MSIDFSKFSSEFKNLYNKAIEDKEITAEEFKSFSKEDRDKLSLILAGNPKALGDIKVYRDTIKSGNNSIDLYADNDSTEGKIDLKDEAKKRYPNASYGMLKNGVMTLYDKNGEVLKDILGNSVKINFENGMQIVGDNEVSGNFEIPEGEDVKRTNRRFAVSLMQTMYNRVIKENLEALRSLGALDMGFWREAMGMGVQKIADLIEDQQAITATTIKRIERIEAERDNVCNSLQELIDNPEEFMRKFYELTGCEYNDNKFDRIRDICHNEDNEKSSQVRYNKCVEEFNNSLKDNKIQKYLEGNTGSKIFDGMSKFCDGVADIIAMFFITGGIGSVAKGAGTKIATNVGQEILKQAAKGNVKNVLAQMPKFTNFVKNAVKSNPVQFATNLGKGATLSMTTMSAYEGGKTFINGITNGEDLSLDEIISRTIDSLEGGAEMGLEMTALQTFAIGPIMNKLTPVLNRATGATKQVTKLLSESGKNGVAMSDITKIYEDCAATTRGIIATEGLHLGVTLPVMVAGFTTADSIKAFLAGGDSPEGYSDESFKAMLLQKAESQEERDKISQMTNLELRAKFVEQNLVGQLQGMATIEGVSLAMRRYQAARLAGQAIPKGAPDLLDAKMYTVEKNGKTYYELRDPNNKLIPVDTGNGKPVARFSSPDRATAAYQAMCLNIMKQAQNGTLADAVKAAKPQDVMKPTEASTISNPGITFTPNPNGEPAKAYRLIWCDTVEETIAKNNERGIPLELYKDPKTGEYKLGIKHSWDDGYFGVDRESAIVNYDYTAEKPSDWAVVAEDEGAQIFSKTYLKKETGKTASLADIEPGQGMVIVKNPESVVGASAYEGGKDMTSLEEPLGNVDFVRTDVDGHPYGSFNDLVKDINRGKIQANPKDPNSVRFVELVKAGKTEEARQLLLDATKKVETALASQPSAIMKPTEATTFGKEDGITFKPNVNPNDPPSNAYKIAWGKTVEETIALNQKNGVPLELVKDESTGEFFLGIKHSWDNEYYRVDRESIIVKYGEGDFAPVAEDNGAHIFTQTYLDAKTGKPIDVSKMKPGEPLQIVKNPNSTVGAVTFEKPTTVISLEGDMPNVEMARTDVDGHPYGTYEQLAKDIRRGKLVANESDPNSARFIELVKAGKDAEAQALLKQASLKPAASLSAAPKITIDSPEFQAVTDELKALYKKGSDNLSKAEKDRVAELEYTIQAQGVLVARSPIIQQSKISMIAIANPRDIFIPDFSNEAQLKEFGYIKGEDGKWHNNAKNKDWFPNALAEDDVIYVYERDANGRPIDTGHGPAYELKQMYVRTEDFDNDNMKFIDPATMTPGQIISAKKCASGTFCILPIGTKIFSSEGLVEVKSGQIANIKEGQNSVHLSNISDLPGMYKADPMNPASKKLFDKISEYKEKEATLTEQEKIEAQYQIAETFGSVDRGQQLIDILGTGEQRPVTLREKFDVAARISKVIDEKYLSRIDCSNFDKGLEQAGKVMDEILADNTLNDAQKQAAIMGIMTHMVTATNLHQHGKGSTPKDVTLALAREKGLPESTIADIEAAYAQADKGYPVLSEFNRAYDVIGQVIRTPEDYKASIDGIIRESIKRGQLVCEIRCACDSLRDAATGKSLTPREGTLAIMKAIEDVKAELRAEGIEPPETSFVFLTFRGKGWDGSLPMAVTQAKEAVRIAEEHPDMKFGYDVAGPEDTGWGPKAFKEAMDIINQHNEDVKAGRKKGNTIGVTMHAGETPTYEGGEGYKSVLDAIEMGAVRIGHGIQLAKYLKEMETKNPKEFNRVLNMVKEKGITIEICGVCNIQSIPINSEGMEQHAIQTFLDYGIPVTICTDNDAICGTNISKEYTQFLLTGHSNFMDWNAIKQSVRDGVDAAFITDAQKAKVRTELDNRIARLQKLYDEKMNGASVDSKKKGSTVSTQTENVGQTQGASTQAPRESGVKAETEVKVNEQARRTLNTFVSSRAADNALSNSRLNLSQYGKNGIPLKYTRESFIKDLDQLLSNLPASERAKIESEFGIKIENTASTQLGKEIVGIPKVPKDIVGTPNEQAVARLIRKFTVENEVEIADIETKQLLESVLQTFPEFAMTVGKKQHGTHAYSVDVHTLKNLQDNLAHPKYAQLDVESQMVLKYATILHDIGKRFLGDKQPDHGHADLSAQYAKQILERFDLPDNVKARIIKLVEKHHWFEKYCKGGQSPEEIARVVETFDTMEDLTIAEIMAKSDYQNVNEDFHLNKWRNWVDGDGLMTKAEFDNYMEASFSKIDNSFVGYKEDSKRCKRILDLASKVETNEVQLMKYSEELLSYYRLTDGKCSPVVMETVNKINAKVVSNLFTKNISKNLINVEKSIKEHYKDGQIPESDYSVEMWEKDWNGNKSKNFDRTLDDTATKTCAMIIDFMKFDKAYLDSPSGIEGLTKRDLLINFSKYINVKGTTGFYLSLAKDNPSMFENIMHSMLNQYQVADFSKSAATIYKRSSWPMNTALNSMYIPFVENGFKHYDNAYAFDFIGHIQEHPNDVPNINELSALIDKCPLKNKSVTYRGGQLNELDIIRIDDGHGNKVCADAIVQKFLDEHPNATGKEIETFIFNLLKGTSHTKPRYMSTTCNKDLATAWAVGNQINGGKQEKVKLLWKINADAGTKALFMEQVNNMGNNYYDQFEFLFQRQTTLNFINCHFDEKTGILELEVKATQPKKLEKFKDFGIPNEQELLTLKQIYNNVKALRNSNPQRFSNIQKKLYDAANELLNGKNDLYLKLMQDSEILKFKN